MLASNYNIKLNCSPYGTRRNIPSLIFASETEILEGKIQASEPSSSAPDQFSGAFLTAQKSISLMSVIGKKVFVTKLWRSVWIKEI
jgi:hypothetical protein